MIAALVFIGIIIMALGYLMYIIGTPVIIIAVFIGAFFFVGAPIYALLNYLELGKNKIKDKIHETNQEEVFEKYKEDTQKEYAEWSQGQ